MTRKVLALLIACIIVMGSFGFNVMADGEESTGDPKVVKFYGAELNTARIFDEEEEVVIVASFSEAVRTLSIMMTIKGTEGACDYAIYAFDTDYEISRLGEEVKMGSFQITKNGYHDITWEEDALPAGIYVIVLNNFAGMSGVRYNGVYDGQYVVENGQYTSGNALYMQVTYDAVPAKPFGDLVKPEIETTGDVFPGGVMFFDEEDADTWFSEVGNNCENSIVNGALNIQIKAAGDPYFKILARSGVKDLSCAEYPVLVMKMRKSEGTSNQGEFFFDTTEFKGWSVKGSVKFTYQDTTDWQLVIVDFGNNTNFKGNMRAFRYDPFPSCSQPSTVEIAWMAFFSDLEVAKAFDGDFEKLYATPTPDPNATPTPTMEPTTAPTQALVTNVPVDATRPPVAPEKKEGCGSSGIAQVMVILGAALIIKKKK